MRNQTRIIGRARDNRIISRPLLVKGLEYDHAVVLNAERYSATELYVALSRSRKSLTVVSNERYLRPTPPQL
jgi:DNA helicase IV